MPQMNAQQQNFILVSIVHLLGYSHHVCFFSGVRAEAGAFAVVCFRELRNASADTLPHSAANRSQAERNTRSGKNT